MCDIFLSLATSVSDLSKQNKIIFILKMDLDLDQGQAAAALLLMMMADEAKKRMKKKKRSEIDGCGSENGFCVVKNTFIMKLC